MKSAKESLIVSCGVCMYARPCAIARIGKRAAIECGNPASEYYLAVLNMTYAGVMLSGAVWEGCRDGAEKRRAV